MSIDKTYSELWDLVNTYEDETVKETAQMAINTLQKLQTEIERLKEYSGQLEQEHDSMSKSLYKIVRIANKGLED